MPPPRLVLFSGPDTGIAVPTSLVRFEYILFLGDRELMLSFSIPSSSVPSYWPWLLRLECGRIRSMLAFGANVFAPVSDRSPDILALLLGRLCPGWN